MRNKLLLKKKKNNQIWTMRQLTSKKANLFSYKKLASQNNKKFRLIVTMSLRIMKQWYFTKRKTQSQIFPIKFIHLSAPIEAITFCSKFLIKISTKWRNFTNWLKKSKKATKNIWIEAISQIWFSLKRKIPTTKSIKDQNVNSMLKKSEEQWESH